MHHIYTNNPKFLFKLKIKLPIKVIVNFEKFQNIESNSKIIIYFPLNDSTEDFNFYKNLSETANFVFIIDDELWKSHVELMKKSLALQNVFWYRSGFLNVEHNINMQFYGSWFYYEKELYKDILFKLQEINPYVKKNYHFEALLGLKRIHRDFIFEKIQNFVNNHKFLYNYSNLKDKNWFTEPNVNFLKNVDIDAYNNSLMPCEYYGKHCLVSQVIPIDVYNNTAFSIVAETGFLNNYSYMTEKTVKPIMGKRLFIIFSGVNFLKNLQSLGFKTFDGIINESYDQILDNEERWTAAWQQVEWLCNQDQQEIYEKIKPICEYNFNLMMETDWISITGESIKNIIT